MAQIYKRRPSDFRILASRKSPTSGAVRGTSTEKREVRCRHITDKVLAPILPRTYPKLDAKSLVLVTFSCHH